MSAAASARLASPAPGPTPSSQLTSSSRLTSLDAFRGLTIAGMILVNHPGSWAYVYPPLRHAVWHGATVTDLVFPFFLFAVGASLSFSSASRKAKGHSRGKLWVHVLQRALILYMLGLFLSAVPRFDFETLRLVGVLERIGMTYLVAGTMVLFLSRRIVFAAIPVILLGYWALMTLVPVPGFGAGDLSPAGNLAAWLDRLVLGANHMWSGGDGVYDPEGLLSTLPAVASVLAGLFVGDHLRAGDARIGRLLGLGFALVLAGHAWDLVFPINKPIWTSSYVVYTTGWAVLVLGALHWTMEVRGLRSWARPLVVYGMNAITVFVGSGLLTKTLILWRVPDGADGTTSAYAWIYRNLFASWAGPLNGSLAFAMAMVGLWLVVAWVMHRRRVFVKI